MNVLFMSLADFQTINAVGLYESLLREFAQHGDKVYVLSPVEKRNWGKNKIIIREKNATIIKFQIGNIQKTSSILEKGISTITVTSYYINAIKNNLSDVKFDLILYPTPPITLLSAIKYIKKRDGAKTYLLLKDIFPQNAVDLGMMSTTGIKGIIYRYFRRKEKEFYQISNYIGCMSTENVKYLLRNNPEIDENKVEVCPNTAEPIDYSVSQKQREKLRKKYEIPLDKKVFIYGGNLGKPQGIPFLINCLKEILSNTDVFFLIVGSGTQYSILEKFIKEKTPSNVKLMQRMPKCDYDQLIGSCDIGLIFLDYNFTIPNFPSRILSYMQANLPILAVTDRNTDVGKVIVDGGFGWWCESNDTKKFAKIVSQIANGKLTCDGEKGFLYLQKHFTPEIAYKIINKHFKTI